MSVLALFKLSHNFNKTQIQVVMTSEITHSYYNPNNMNDFGNQNWTQEEDDILKEAVAKSGDHDWETISSALHHRTEIECYNRWHNSINTVQVKGAWSPEEDALVLKLVKEYGPKKWSQIAKHLHGRIGKQCRERWLNHLNPVVTKGEWTEEEDRAILLSHQANGNKWATLANQLPGR